MPRSTASLTIWPPTLPFLTGLLESLPDDLLIVLARLSGTVTFLDAWFGILCVSGLVLRSHG
jgi:hypothetical protein